MGCPNPCSRYQREHGAPFPRRSDRRDADQATPGVACQRAQTSNGAELDDPRRRPERIGIIYPGGPPCLRGADAAPTASPPSGCIFRGPDTANCTQTCDLPRPIRIRIRHNGWIRTAVRRQTQLGASLASLIVERAGTPLRSEDPVLAHGIGSSLSRQDSTDCAQ